MAQTRSLVLALQPGLAPLPRDRGIRRCREGVPAPVQDLHPSAPSRGPLGLVAAGLLAGAAARRVEAPESITIRLRRRDKRVVLVAPRGAADLAEVDTGDEPPDEAAGSPQRSAMLQRLRQEVARGSHDAAVRLFVSAGSGLRHEMLQILEQETMQLTPERFRLLLRAMRLGEISAEVLVQLYRRVESWFRSQQPDVEDWAQVVYALALSGRLEEAASIVETMETGSDPVYPQPDARMYNLLIRELAKQRGLSTATSLWSRMAARGLVPDGVYFLLMVAVCASSDPPQLDRAKRYLRRGEMLMKRQKVNFRFQQEYDVAQLYSALMAGYLRMGRLTEAFTVLGTMRQHGVRPSAVTFCILQQCCFARMDPSSDVRQLLRIMEQIGVPPETSNYNELIKCYGLQGQMTLALGVANRMREAGIAWDSFTYFALIRSVCAAGQVELAMKLLTRMRQDGIRPGASHYTCTFIGLAAADYYEDATRVFQRLVDVGGARSQFPYNMMMAIHSRRGDMEAAEEVLEEMTEAGWPADVTTYQILVQGYVAACDWPAALALEEKVADLRRGLVRIREDPGVTQAAQEAANGQLQQKRVWTKVYHLLVDAAVYNAEWPRAVQIIEELVGYGLPVNYAKHARLLEDTLPSTRAGLAMKGVYSRGTNMDWATADERQKVLMRAYYRWSEEVPNVQRGIVAEDENQQEAQIAKVQASITLPPHVFSASFYPGWLDGGDGSMEEHSEIKLWRRYKWHIREGESDKESLARDGHEILYLHHHATVHRRPLLSVTLVPGRPLIGRVVPESLDSLRELFDAFGWPGTNGAVYAFLRPAAAKLDALLAILAAAAAYPEDVLLLRSQEEAIMSNLTLECRERNCRAISFSLASMLRQLPAGLLVNQRFLVTNSQDVVKTKCRDFDDSFRKSLVQKQAHAEMTAFRNIVPEEDDEHVEPGQDGEEDEEDKRRGDDASVWVSWLRRHRLHQMMRFDGEQLRLDGIMHRPALSEGDSFRARAQSNGEVSVDVALPEQPDADGLSSFLSWW